MNELGDRLRMLRRRRYTQEELADKVGVHVNTISRWENGTREPDLERLCALAVLLSTSTAYLLGETNDPTPGGSQSHVIHLEGQNVMQDVANHGSIAMTSENGTKSNFELPWWVTLPQEVYRTVKIGDQQDIDTALDAIRTAMKMLERAQKFTNDDHVQQQPV